MKCLRHPIRDAPPLDLAKADLAKRAASSAQLIAAARWTQGVNSIARSSRRNEPFKILALDWSTLLASCQGVAGIIIRFERSGRRLRVQTVFRVER